jgi:multidrug resistance efflux pump
MRFRKELEDAQAAAAASSADNSMLRARLELAESQVAAVEAFTRKRYVCQGRKHISAACVYVRVWPAKGSV